MSTPTDTERLLEKWCVRCDSANGWTEEKPTWCAVCWKVRRPIPRWLVKRLERTEAERDSNLTAYRDMVRERDSWKERHHEAEAGLQAAREALEESQRIAVDNSIGASAACARIVRVCKSALGSSTKEQAMSVPPQWAIDKWESDGFTMPDDFFELAGRLQAAREALRGVSNAYGCFAGCAGALPGAPDDGHTPACRAARAALGSSTKEPG